MFSEESRVTLHRMDEWSEHANERSLVDASRLHESETDDVALTWDEVQRHNRIATDEMGIEASSAHVPKLSQPCRASANVRFRQQS